MRTFINHPSIDPHGCIDDIKMPLVEAACKGSLEIIKLLLSHNDIKIEDRDTDGNTALMEAIRSGHLEVAKLLSQHCDQQRLSNLKGRTLLHTAACQPNLAVLNFVMTLGQLDLNARDSEACTALHLAARYGRYMIVKKLIETRGVGLNSRARPKMRTPLLEAICCRQTRVAKLPIRHEGVNLTSTTATGRNALWLAAEKNGYRLIPSLLSADPDCLNVPDSCSLLPLHVALEAGYQCTLYILLEHLAKRLSPQHMSLASDLAYA